MAIPTLGAMIAAMGSPAEWGAIATTKFYWDDANGRLGIGTQTPNAPLEVVGRVIGSNLVVGAYNLLNDTTGVASTLQFGNSAMTAPVAGSADAYIYKTTRTTGSYPFSAGSSGSMVFQVRSDVDAGHFVFISGSTPTAKMVISSTGYVGIGTTAPGSIFVVRDGSGGNYSETRMSYILHDASIALDIAGYGDNNGTMRQLGSIRMVLDDGSANVHGSLRFLTVLDNTLTERLTILGSGNVGIGTTSPGAPLTVDGLVGVPASSGTVQGGIFRIGTSLSSRTNVLDFGKYNASPYGLWIQGTDAADLSLKYPLILQPNGGNVGIGTTGPGYILDVNGAIHGTSHSDSSDERFKEKISQIKNALSSLINLTGIEFEWNDLINIHRDGYKKNKKEIGFSAQQVEQYFPEVVEKWELKNKNGEMVLSDARAINYSRMTPILVEAIKELNTRLSALDKKSFADPNAWK